MKTYWAAFLMRAKMETQYRAAALSGLATQLFFGLILVYLYRALYGDFCLWVRPVSMWNEPVERDGKTFRRFTYIGE